MKARKTDPKSSHDAAKASKSAASRHRAIIRKALDKRPRQTAYELRAYLKGELSYHQIMRRLNECAQKGELRECKTGTPSKNVLEWF